MLAGHDVGPGGVRLHTPPGRRQPIVLIGDAVSGDEYDACSAHRHRRATRTFFFFRPSNARRSCRCHARPLRQPSSALAHEAMSSVITIPGPTGRRSGRSGDSRTNSMLSRQTLRRTSLKTSTLRCSPARGGSRSRRAHSRHGRPPRSGGRPRCRTPCPEPTLRPYSAHPRSGGRDEAGRSLSFPLPASLSCARDTQRLAPAGRRRPQYLGLARRYRSSSPARPSTALSAPLTMYATRLPREGFSFGESSNRGLHTVL